MLLAAEDGDHLDSYEAVDRRSIRSVGYSQDSWIDRPVEPVIEGLAEREVVDELARHALLAAAMRG